jgi:glycosyltransferase involved in cell wall biosynthesis
VHVMRLREALRDTFHVEVIDLYSRRSKADEREIVRCGRRRPLNAVRAVLALLRRPAPLVHFHVAGMDAFLYAIFPLLAALRRSTKKIVTIHSGSFVARFERGPAWRRTLLRYVLRRFDRVVAVSQEQRIFLERIGIERRRIAVVPAFLPPIARETVRVREALQLLAGCGRIVVSSGYGLPYYGFECAIDALESLERGRRDCGLIFCMYNTYDEEYVARLERRFAGNIRGLILRDLAPDEFAWILQRCDVYVRATDRDGDAVAIREAQYYGKMVIASDCVERPAYVRLFKTNDSVSLAHALYEADTTNVASQAANPSSGLSDLLEIYDEALIA